MYFDLWAEVIDILSPHLSGLAAKSIGTGSMPLARACGSQRAMASMVSS